MYEITESETKEFIFHSTASAIMFVFVPFVPQVPGQGD